MNDELDWTWSEPNVGWFCGKMQMGEESNGNYVVANGDTFKRFRFKPTPQQAQIVLQSSVRDVPLSKTTVERIVANYFIQTDGWTYKGFKKWGAEGVWFQQWTTQGGFVLWLVWRGKPESSKGTWAHARLDFRPTPDEARAAVELSPADGSEMAPMYSKEQIHRFMEKSKDDQEKQVEVAKTLYRGEVYSEAEKAIIVDGGLNTENRMKAKTQNFNSKNDGKCKHETCARCKKEISCMEEDRKDDTGIYHLRCWEQEQVDMGWDERSLTAHAEDDRWFAEGVGMHWSSRSQTCSIWPNPLPDDKPWPYGQLSFNPTPEQARYCLKLFGTGYKEVISRTIYASFSNIEAAIARIREVGLTVDEKIIEKILEDQQGQNFEEFLKERQTCSHKPTCGLEEPKIKEGDVVDVRATDLDVEWPEAFRAVFMFFHAERKHVTVVVKIGSKRSARVVATNRCTLAIPKEEL